MLDELFEFGEGRDKKRGTAAPRQGGIRGFFQRLFAGEDADEHRRYDGRDGDYDRKRRDYDHDDDDDYRGNRQRNRRDEGFDFD